MADFQNILTLVRQFLRTGKFHWKMKDGAKFTAVLSMVISFVCLFHFFEIVQNYTDSGSTKDGLYFL